MKIIEINYQKYFNSKFPKMNETSHTKKLKPIIEKLFKDHPGKTENFWFATEYNDVIKLLNFFIKEKSNLFGDYEDAVDQKDNILFHSALSPYINLGLITPELVIKKFWIFIIVKNKIKFIRRLHTPVNWLERIYERNLSKLFKRDGNRKLFQTK